MQFKDGNIIKILKFLLVILVIFLVIKYVLGYFTPFILGYIICLILNPINKFLKKRGFSKGLASFISITFFITIISFLGTTIISKIIEEGRSFSQNLPSYIENIKDIFINFNKYIVSIIEKLPDFLENIIYTSFESILYFFQDILKESFKTGSVTAIKTIPNFFMVLFISIISAFFFLVDKENIESFIYRQFSDNIKVNLSIIKEGVLTVIFGYIKAQLIIMFIMGTICFFSLSLIRAPYSLFIAFIISFIDALPILGSGTIFLPWAIYQLIVKNYKFAISLFIIYLFMTFTRQFIEHKIIGKQIGLHPLLTLIAIYLGLKLFGFIGIIIMPIFFVIIGFLQKNDLLPRWK